MLLHDRKQIDKSLTEEIAQHREGHGPERNPQDLRSKNLLQEYRALPSISKKGIWVP